MEDIANNIIMAIGYIFVICLMVDVLLGIDLLGAVKKDIQLDVHLV